MPEPQTQFYTYLWLREDGTPYYVGKGKGRRGFRSQGHGVHCPPETSRIIVQEWPCEKDAFSAEKFLIFYYGRLDLGTGILRNLTDGGDGPSGRPITPYHKQRVIESNKLRTKPKKEKEVKPRKKYSEESKANMSAAQKLSWATKRKGKPRKTRERKVPTCHPEAVYGGKGKCKPCYMKEYNKGKKTQWTKQTI